MSSWPLVAVGDIFEIARGGSPRPIQDYITDQPDGINWITISDASAGSKYITGTKRRIRNDGAKSSRVVHPGDFLLTYSMSFGRPYIMRTSGCIHDGWLVFSKKRDDVGQDFFFHLLASNAVYSEFERLAAGLTVKNLNIELVRGVRVRVPPLHEQRRIAEVLDRAEALRAKRRAPSPNSTPLPNPSSSTSLAIPYRILANGRKRTWRRSFISKQGNLIPTPLSRQGRIRFSLAQGKITESIPTLLIAKRSCSPETMRVLITRSSITRGSSTHTSVLTSSHSEMSTIPMTTLGLCWSNTLLN